jgi:hypothetical protein
MPLKCVKSMPTSCARSTIQSLAGCAGAFESGGGRAAAAGSRDGGHGQYQESSFHEGMIVHDEGRVSPALAGRAGLKTRPYETTL